MLDTIPYISEIRRVRFRKSICESYITGSLVVFQIELCSEFESITLKSESLRSWKINLLEVEDNGSLIATPVRVERKLINSDKTVQIRTFAPLSTGKFRFEVIYDTDSAEVVHLGLLSDFFITFAAIDAETHGNLRLQSYRRLLFSDLPAILIKEDYGATIGSHLYDSSIVTCRYLHKVDWRFSKVVELGAGCGLTGLFCSLRHQVSVLMTDRGNQLSILNENIAMNGLKTLAESEVLCWENEDQLNAVQGKLSPDDETLIIAADVLYDLEAAAYLLQMLVKLTSWFSACTVLVAYKNRDLSTRDEVEWKLKHRLQPAFLYTIVHMEANVFILSLSTQ